MIRPMTYRGKIGFSISGRNPRGQKFRIFAHTKDGARRIFAAAKRGDSVTVSKLLLRGE